MLALLAKQPQACTSVALVEQTSRAKCTPAADFGCEADGVFFVQRCRGLFRCDDGPAVACGYPAGKPRYRCSCSGSKIVHFYRIPKTGSSTLLTILPRLRCEGVTVHNHNDGCRHLSWCNGSELQGVLPTQPIFVTVRHVCSRFESQWAHMKDHDHTFVRKYKTLEQFLELLQNWTAGCPAGIAGVHCKVNQINRRYPPNHRVALWPQAFYMARRAMPICYHPRFLEERIQSQVAALTSCKAPFQETISLYRNVREHTSSVTPSICAGVARLYDEDDRLWHRHCDGADGAEGSLDQHSFESPAADAAL